MENEDEIPPAEIQQKIDKTRAVIVSVAIILLVCVVGISGILLVKRIEKESSNGSLVTSPTPTPDPMAPKNVLLLGYGGFGHDGGLLTDTMIVGHIIPKEKKIVLISIPRDLWVPMEAKEGTKSGFKLNAAYAIGSDDKAYPDKPDIYKGDGGGIRMADDAVSEVTGLPIDYTVAVDFSGFTKLLKTLGGVFIDVPYRFEDKWYPLEGKEKEACGKSEEDIEKVTATLSGTLLEQEFPCRYETLKFEKGKQFMDGETALKFVRSRHSDVNGGDFGRSLRQQAFLVGMKNRLLTFTGATKLIPLVRDGIKMVSTDITVQDVTVMIERYGDISSYTFDTIHLTDQTVLMLSTTATGQSILVPKAGDEDWASIATFIQDELVKIVTATPSATTTIKN